MSLIDRDMLVIARREFVERVRTKWFLAGTLLGPIFMVAMVVIPAVLAGRGGEGTKVDIIDQSAPVDAIQLGDVLAKKLVDIDWTGTSVPPTTTDDAELAKIKSKQINGYVRIPADALDAGKTMYYGDNASNQAVKMQFRAQVRASVFEVRAHREHVSAEALKRLEEPVNADAEHTTGATKAASGGATFIIGYMLAFILYMVITLYGVSVMRSVVVEKSSRVMEFMVAAVKPRSLMGGKIIGVGAAGLLQVAIWLGIGALTLVYRDDILGVFGASGGGATLPDLGAMDVAVVIVYFVLGYFFYSSMYAAVGAMVSSEGETQQVQMPITMLLVIGVLCLQAISNDPRSSTAEVLTMVPLWSPMTMPMRYVLGGATLAEVGVSLGILLVSTYLVVRAAAKIYRVGILLYGKRPSAREMLRWLRY
jgi:ABC-2 type transport system permease protein